jgi:hypothetical protein
MKWWPLIPRRTTTESAIPISVLSSPCCDTVKKMDLAYELFRWTIRTLYLIDI